MVRPDGGGLMPVDPDGRFFEGGTAIRVEGGIAVRSKRGDIGARWWSRRFVDQLERICDGGRLARGRAYANLCIVADGKNRVNAVCAGHGGRVRAVQKAAELPPPPRFVL